MMEDIHTEDWVEIEGRSKSDAIERACNALNTTQAYMEYEVIGNKGNKIRARKLAKARTDISDPATAANEDEETPVHESETEHELPPARSELSTDGLRNRSYRERDRGDEEERPRARSTEQVEEVLLEPTELGTKAKEYLNEVLKHIDQAAVVSLEETKSEIRLEIQGNGSGLFIGKHGQTLEALQHIVAKMCGLDRSKSEKRITIDSERYRERRKESLEGLARKLAARARRERRPVSVEPMSALDRRILHMALQDDRSVSTKSVGEGASRKVVIVPRNVGGDSRRGGSDMQRGNSRRGGNFRRASGGGGRRDGGSENRNAGGERTRPRPSGSRMHDSFDVPPVPEHDLFENDDDLLAHSMALEESGEDEGRAESSKRAEKE